MECRLRAGRAVLTWDEETGRSWCELDVDETRLHAKLARRLRGRDDVQCDASLAAVGTKAGWAVKAAPEAVRTLAAGVTVAEALDLPVKLAVSPLVTELVRACGAFLAARPWEHLANDTALEVQVDGKTKALATLLPDSGRGPALLMVIPPDKGLRNGFNVIDHLFFMLGSEPTSLSRRLAKLGAAPFHPTCQRTFGASMDEPHVTLVSAVLRAVVSLTTGSAVGRAELGGKQVLAVPVSATEAPAPQTAS
jgi:hypothetical protein